MDFDLPGEDDPRRLEIRAWTKANPNPTPRQLLDVGYLAPHWPAPYGLSAAPELQILIDDELQRAGIKRPYNVVAESNCGPSLLTHGTPEAKERYLIPGLLGEERWCQLFSEPSGGSDLSALRTTAVRDGDHYIVNGSKIWTSGAHHAFLGSMPVRTDPHAAKHAGISNLLVELKSPGITIRPIADMSGYPNEFNEVFFDNVRVPVVNRLGEEGDGWRLTMQMLQSERVKFSQPGGAASALTARDLVIALNNVGALRDAGIQEEAAKLYIEGEMLRLLSMRSLSDRINARRPGPEAAVGKMINTPHTQRIFQLALQVNGHKGMLEGEQQFSPDTRQGEGRGNWNFGPWFTPALTLMVGTTEIMRNVVGERVLGLPRELDPSAKGDWSQQVQNKPPARAA